MADVGITRFCITDKIVGRGRWRFIKARRCWPAANLLYRSIYDKLGAPLFPGEKIIETSLAEFEAGYDRELGIDVLLIFESGMETTLQEKFLFTKYRTVTIEYMQDWRTQEPGDWFNLKAQCYFVGYDRINAFSFQDWILLDWPAIQRATAQGRIIWREKRNRHNGARASFRYVDFDDIPAGCVVANSNNRPIHPRLF